MRRRTVEVAEEVEAVVGEAAAVATILLQQANPLRQGEEKYRTAGRQPSRQWQNHLLLPKLLPRDTLAPPRNPRLLD